MRLISVDTITSPSLCIIVFVGFKLVSKSNNAIANALFFCLDLPRVVALLCPRPAMLVKPRSVVTLPSALPGLHVDERELLVRASAGICVDLFRLIPERCPRHLRKHCHTRGMSFRCLRESAFGFMQERESSLPPPRSNRFVFCVFDRRRLIYCIHVNVHNIGASHVNR